jgi:hypothetical protein
MFKHFYDQYIVFRKRRSLSTNNSCPCTIDIFSMIQFHFNIELLSMKEPFLYGNYEKLFCSLQTTKTYSMSYVMTVNTGGFEIE